MIGGYTGHGPRLGNCVTSLTTCFLKVSICRTHLFVWCWLCRPAVRQQSWEGLELRPQICNSMRAHLCKCLKSLSQPADAPLFAFLSVAYVRFHKCATYSASGRVPQAFHYDCSAPAAVGSPVRPAFACVAIWAPLATSHTCYLSARQHMLLGRCMHTHYCRAVPCCSSCVTHVQWLNA